MHLGTWCRYGPRTAWFQETELAGRSSQIRHRLLDWRHPAGSAGCMGDIRHQTSDIRRQTSAPAAPAIISTGKFPAGLRQSIGVGICCHRAAPETKQLGRGSCRYGVSRGAAALPASCILHPAFCTRPLGSRPAWALHRRDGIGSLVYPPSRRAGNMRW